MHATDVLNILSDMALRVWDVARQAEFDVFTALETSLVAFTFFAFLKQNKMHQHYKNPQVIGGQSVSYSVSETPEEKRDPTSKDPTSAQILWSGFALTIVFNSAVVMLLAAPNMKTFILINPLILVYLFFFNGWFQNLAFRLRHIALNRVRKG